jgi:hypothetical protein
MSTTAVIIARLEALDVDVVQRGLHQMRRLLVAERLAALERRGVRLVGVLVRPLVVAVELFLELVDGSIVSSWRTSVEPTGSSTSSDCSCTWVLPSGAMLTFVVLFFGPSTWSSRVISVRFSTVRSSMPTLHCVCRRKSTGSASAIGGRR